MGAVPGQGTEARKVGERAGAGLKGVQSRKRRTVARGLKTDGVAGRQTRAWPRPEAGRRAVGGLMERSERDLDVEVDASREAGDSRVPPASKPCVWRNLLFRRESLGCSAPRAQPSEVLDVILWESFYSFANL